jgi:hypothetical protein
MQNSAESAQGMFEDSIRATTHQAIKNGKKPSKE